MGGNQSIIVKTLLGNELQGATGAQGCTLLLVEVLKVLLVFRVLLVFGGQGVQGTFGTSGSQGQAGPQGSTGAQGTSIQGQTGAGTQGRLLNAQGTTGTQGVQGPNGSASLNGDIWEYSTINSFSASTGKIHSSIRITVLHRKRNDVIILIQIMEIV